MAAAEVVHSQRPQVYSPGIDSPSMSTNITNSNAVVHSKARPPAFPSCYRVVELRVPICCQACEENVRFELTSLDGVDEIGVDMETQKVVVKGDIRPLAILTTVKKVDRRAELWTN